VVVERNDRTSYGLVRKAVSWVNLLLVRLLFRSPCRDHNFIQFYRREIIEAVPVRSTGVSTVTLEFIVRASRQGFRVVRMAADYHQRRAGRSTVTARKVFHALVQTLRLWLLLRQEKQACQERSAHPMSEVVAS
jgi:hypothetical protein